MVTSNSTSFTEFTITFKRNKFIEHCKARNFRFCDLRMVTVQEWISRTYLQVRHDQGSDSFIYVNITVKYTYIKDIHASAMNGMQGNVLKLFQSIKLSQIKKMYRRKPLG